MTKSSGSELVSEKTNKIINDDEENKKSTKFSFKLIRILSMIVISSLFAIISYQSYPIYSLDNIRDSITFLFDDSFNTNNANDRSLQYTVAQLTNKFGDALPFRRNKQQDPSEPQNNQQLTGGRDGLTAEDLEKMHQTNKKISKTESKFNNFFKAMPQKSAAVANYFKAKLTGFGIDQLAFRSKGDAVGNTGVIILTVLEVLLKLILDPAELALTSIAGAIEFAEAAEATATAPNDVKRNVNEWKGILNNIINDKQAKEPLILKGTDKLSKLAGVCAFILSAACPPVGAVVATVATITLVIKYTAKAAHWLYRNRHNLINAFMELANAVREIVDIIKQDPIFKGEKDTKDVILPPPIPLTNPTDQQAQLHTNQLSWQNNQPAQPLSWQHQPQQPRRQRVSRPPPNNDDLWVNRP